MSKKTKEKTYIVKFKFGSDFQEQVYDGMFKMFCDSVAVQMPMTHKNNSINIEEAQWIAGGGKLIKDDGSIINL